jgi:hypothetical protein
MWKGKLNTKVYCKTCSFIIASGSYNFVRNQLCAILSGSIVTTAWRVLRLRMEETASRCGGYVCIRGGLLQPLHLDPQWFIMLNPDDR